MTSLATVIGYISSIISGLFSRPVTAPRFCSSPRNVNWCNRMNHLGRLLEDDTVSLVDPASITALHTSPAPRNKEMFSFLCFAGWCRDDGPNFSKVAFPLFEMLRQNAPARFYALKTARKEAFTDISNHTAPGLRLTDLSRPIELEVDASKIQVRLCPPRTLTGR